MRIVSLALLLSCLLFASCLSFAGVPSAGSDLYDNGPVNGNVDAWFLGSASDSVEANGTITGLQFWAWLLPGYTLSNLDVAMGSSPFGTNLFNMTVDTTQSNCSVNVIGWNVCLESASFSGPTLSGTSWLTLEGTNLPAETVAWDENSGVGCQSPGCPSQAELIFGGGTIPSEAFTLYGSASSTGSTPEPATVVLFGCGIMGVIGTLRRKRES